MNPWQVTQQILKILAALAWADSPSDPILGQVWCSAIDPSWLQKATRFPCAVVTPGPVTYLPEHSQIVDEARWFVYVFAANANDAAGGAAVQGANRTSLGVSAGRGVEELVPAVIEGLRAGTVGMGVRVVGASDARVEARDTPGLVASRPIELVGRRPLQTAPGFSPVTRALGTGLAGSVTLSWLLPGPTSPARWDLVGLVVRRAAGAVAPTTPSGGTGVTVSGLASGVVDTPGSGTWSYAIFATYDEGRDPVAGTQPATPLTVYSEAATVTSVVA